MNDLNDEIKAALDRKIGNKNSVINSEEKLKNVKASLAGVKKKYKDKIDQRAQIIDQELLDLFEAYIAGKDFDINKTQKGISATFKNNLNYTLLLKSAERIISIKEDSRERQYILTYNFDQPEERTSFAGEGKEAILNQQIKHYESLIIEYESMYEKFQPENYQITLSLSVSNGHVETLREEFNNKDKFLMFLFS